MWGIGAEGWRDMAADGGQCMFWCGVGGGDAQREAEEESSLCVERSEGWGYTFVGRRCGKMWRVLFKEG